MKRRTFLLSAAALGLIRPALADTTSMIKVFKSPTCGCCTAWVEHVRQAGFAVEAQNVDQDALYAFKDRLQIAPELAGCHTAVVGDYFVDKSPYWIEISQDEASDLRPGTELQILGQYAGNVESIRYVPDSDQVRVDANG